jgi:hypothetical protein
MKPLFLLVALLAALPLGEAWAWDQEGHSIVAEIAQRRLTPTALAKAKELLGGEVSLASISSWADEIREQRPQTYRWHFVDIPLKESTYDAARECDPNHGSCVIDAIARFRAVLGNEAASRTERVEALMYLVHFVADVHQPLHTVTDNRGENDLAVTFFVDPTNTRRDPTNLHKVWDSGLIRNQFWNWGAYERWLEANWFPGKDVAGLSAGTPVDWALEAHAVAAVVCDGVAPNDALDQAYAQKVRPQLDRQLAVAGLRLARVLNETLK